MTNCAPPHDRPQCVPPLTGKRSSATGVCRVAGAGISGPNRRGDRSGSGPGCGKASGSEALPASGVSRLPVAVSRLPVAVSRPPVGVSRLPAGRVVHITASCPQMFAAGPQSAGATPSSMHASTAWRPSAARPGGPVRGARHTRSSPGGAARTTVARRHRRTGSSWSPGDAGSGGLARSGRQGCPVDADRGRGTWLHGGKGLRRDPRDGALWAPQ
jgi:hypothetical protein